MTRLADGRTIRRPIDEINGFLAAAEADLYQAPALCKATIGTLICHNTHAANSNTVRLYLQRSGGGSLNFVSQDLAPGERLESRGDPLELNAGTKLRGMATNANEVTWLISGEEVFGIS